MIDRHQEAIGSQHRKHTNHSIALIILIDELQGFENQQKKIAQVAM